MLLAAAELSIEAPGKCRTDADSSDSRAWHD
jgi:hypothetical protein